MTQPRVAVTMIVKDEAHVIRRCLDSVLPVVDSWAIVDTGSTDGTQEVIRQHLAHLPGALVEEPWVDFSTNRNQSLELARSLGAEYALVIDADDVLELDPGAGLPELVAPGYWLEIQAGATRIARVQLVRLELPWRYVSVVHEHLALAATGGARRAAVPGLAGMRMRTLRDGARWQDRSTAMARDAAALEQACAEHPAEMRMLFYLAQTYAQQDRHDEARARYLEVVRGDPMGEHGFHARLGAARMLALIGADPDAVIAELQSACAMRPTRSEPLVDIARIANAHGRHAEAEAALLRVDRSPATPEQGLWFEADTWGASWDAEMAFALMGLGRPYEAVAHAKGCLDDPDAPATARSRAEQCIEHAARGAIPVLGPDDLLAFGATA